MSVYLNDCKSGATSQHGEEGVIAAVFNAIGVRSKTCVEFGAYDLKDYSNVYPLWVSGWQGGGIFRQTIAPPPSPILPG